MTSLSGEKIGAFRVLELLGQGGMGDVYVGVDERLDRRVALKVLRSDLHPGTESQQRFLREARVLSQVAHPNICQIFDYLSSAGREVLVLELIEGQSLARAMKRSLAFRQKLAIARQIAEALLAAHEKGIIHRDLKPENILITPGNQVKILDFGISRLQEEGPEPPRAEPGVQLPLPGFEDGLTRPASAPAGDPEEITAGTGAAPGRSTSLTSQGSIIGTLAYMSPEQARGEMAQAASDLYSLGLVLQELFTGHRPYPKGLESAELLERAREGRTLPVAGIDADVAALIRRLTAFAPAARPSSADALERILWIQGKPGRRRRKALVAAALAVMGLFSGGMTIQTLRARRAERATREEAEATRRVADFLTGLFKVSDPGEARGNTVTARELLDKGARDITGELVNQPQVRAQLMDTMGMVYYEMGLYPQARPLLMEALAIRERTLPPTDLKVAESLNDLGMLELKEGAFDQGAAHFQRCLAIRTQRLGAGSLAVATTQGNLGGIYYSQGKYDLAEPLYRQSLRTKEGLLGPRHGEVATALNNLASLLWQQGKYAEAEPLFLRNLAIEEATRGSDHPDVALALLNLGILDRKLGKYAEAEAYLRRSLAVGEKVQGPSHPSVAATLSNLGTTLQQAGRPREAEPLILRALAIQEKTLGPGHPEVARTLSTLGALCHALGRDPEAIARYRASIAVGEKALGATHPSLAGPLTHLGELYMDRGNFAAAEPLYLRGLALTAPALGDRHPGVAGILLALARIEAELGRKAQALGYLARAVKVDGKPDWLGSLRQEPQLRSLRGDPEFERMAAEAARP
ncbi:serine/threonine-protein kinase [Mesoterricola silvestris]|uniref:Protein kinase domain-containing protein n=1 Tax=Mesoterricola silvestris TaxID=2927979 RepID=A0AA48GQ10_9BACT|nr:serine/threonine-protein kinase [Mesoterricola silvestris]BDU73600.1 hypothetical protein METEAL_27740 [Mesoterricola silvestris]